MSFLGFILSCPVLPFFIFFMLSALPLSRPSLPCFAFFFFFYFFLPRFDLLFSILTCSASLSALVCSFLYYSALLYPAQLYSVVLRSIIYSPVLPFLAPPWSPIFGHVYTLPCTAQLFSLLYALKLASFTSRSCFILSYPPLLPRALHPPFNYCAPLRDPRPSCLTLIRPQNRCRVNRKLCAVSRMYPL